MTADARRFGAIWRRTVASPPSPDADAVYADLVGRLDGADRRFHNLQHIADCLARFDDVASLLDDRDAVEMALWFHDAVYVPGDPCNEQRSAALFLAQSKGASPLFRRRVVRLVLTTRRAAAPRTNDQKFIDDIDLAGFGASWDEFTRHGDLLREEFAAQADDEYFAGQARFLGRLRRRPHLFATGHYRERLEAGAQANLARILAMLRVRGFGDR
jgi:predicted metal-dependent HD superfamily phosphohydrolase